MNRRIAVLVPSICLLIIAVISTLVWINTGRTINPVADRLDRTDQTTETQPARTEISYTATPGITSLEQLKREARDVVIQQSEYGEYVESIEGYKGGDAGKYWSFYVDGVMSDTGASSYMQKGGESIVWKFQKL